MADAHAWLAAAAPDPGGTKERWRLSPRSESLLAVGRVWDMVLAANGKGQAMLELLVSSGIRPGPVLGDARGARAVFLVPPGTAGLFAGGELRGVGRGAWLSAPGPDVDASAGCGWLVAPDGSGVLNDPARLRWAERRTTYACTAGGGAGR